MKRNAFVSGALAVMLAVTPMLQARESAQPASDAQPTCEVQFEQYDAEGIRSAAAAAASAAARPVVDVIGGEPILTQERVVDAYNMVLDKGFPTEDNLLAIEQYLELADETLTPTAKAVQDAVIAEAQQLGITAADLQARSDELQVPETHPDWGQFEYEADQLFNSLPARGNVTVDSQRLIFGLTIAALAAIVLCDIEIQACERDVLDALEDCHKNRVCEEGECADPECCNDKAASDTLNCLACGTNGPDDDYDNCCE